MFVTWIRLCLSVPSILLKPVYTRAGVELTDPQEGCKLKDIKFKRILRRTAMLRSQTVNTIHDLNAQGKSVQEIAQELDISRTTDSAGE
jgi:DNA-binding NarL/FixJ family response regulator